MNIIIVGCGKVGYSIAKHLSEEGNNIVIIDKKDDAFEKILESIDVMAIKGNGLVR
jgi:trk system potassium uptake protein TrkA